MKTKSSVFSETEEEKESVSSNINDTKKKKVQNKFYLFQSHKMLKNYPKKILIKKV